MAKQIDLTPALKRPMDPSQMGRDVAALNNLVGVLNDPRITGAEVPPGVDTKAHATPILDPNALPDPAIEEAKTTTPQQEPNKPATMRDIQKVFYTGRLAVGKDHVAAQTGATIFGLADPIYFLVNFFTNIGVSSTSGKDKPGVRSTMQLVGQWGRNVINNEYPLTPARITFVRMIRSLAPTLDPGDTQHVEWAKFGLDENLWFNSLIKRVNAFVAENPDKRVAVTNVRFENEYRLLVAEGWKHYHVMCSPGTWARRLAKQTLTPESPQVKDYSEQLAQAMDADVIRKLSRQPSGPILRVIWNDQDAKLPSRRLLSVGQYLQECAIQAATVPVNTGE